MNENVLTKSEIQSIKVCGKHLSDVMNIVARAIKPGIDTLSLDTLAESELAKRGLQPAFKNYYVQGVGNYPASLCVSVNDEIVHGIPKKTKILKEGDVVSLDLGGGLDGVYTDMARTYGVGEIDTRKARLIRATLKCLDLGISEAKAGNHIGDIGYAIEQYARSENLGIITDFVGHGIGKKPHLWPHIPNFGEKGSGPEITEGMALAIEPMMTLGSGETKGAPDGWTILSVDSSIAAHFEDTVVVENGQPVRVTA